MHYGNGNYEAFVNASKPKDVDQKSAYIVGSGLAAQDESFSHPDVFCKDIPKANWRMSATITIKDSTGFLATQSVISHTLRHKSQMN